MSPSQKPLTDRQNLVLYIVSEHGPATARDVDYHTLMGTDAARGILARLERRALVDAHYTHHRGRGRAYVISDRGVALVNEPEDDDG